MKTSYKIILGIFIAIIFINAIFSFQHLNNLIRKNIVLSENDAKFLAETNRDFIIFYAVLFFTCIVGIIEMLQLNISLSHIPFFILYMILLLGIIFSTRSSFKIYRFNAMLTRSGLLGKNIKILNKKFPTDIDFFIYNASGVVVESILLIIIIVALLILLFDRLKVSNSKISNARETDREVCDKRIDKSILIVEYNILNNVVDNRASANLRFDSIMIPSSIVVLIFAIQYRNDLGLTLLYDLPVAFFIPFLALILIIIPYFNHFTAHMLDDRYFTQIDKIEQKLGIKGRHSIYNDIKDKFWFKIRRNMWHVFFWLLICIYIYSSYWILTNVTQK